MGDKNGFRLLLQILEALNVPDKIAIQLLLKGQFWGALANL